MKRINPQTYHSYLIRLWPGSNQQWHATLQDVHTGEQQAFGDLPALFAFLAQQAAADGSDAAPPDDRP